MDTNRSQSPIYNQLVQEKGDVPAQVRAAAEHVRQQGERHLSRTSQPASPDSNWFS